MKIRVISVNHHMAEYLELMLLSLLYHHTIDDNTDVVVMDNDSGDLERLEWTQQYSIEIRQSGYKLDMPVDTHGEVLRKAILEYPDCDAYLIADPDACFIEDGTIQKMYAELIEDPSLYAVQAAWSTDGSDVIENPTSDRHIQLRLLVRHSERDDWKTFAECGAQEAERVHTFCLLLKNDETVRRVIESIGLSPAGRAMYADNVWWDTGGLLNEVMKTHGRGWRVSEHKVIHLSDACLGADAPENMKELRSHLMAKYKKAILETRRI